MELEDRKKKERDFHNKIRIVTDNDEGVLETRWSPDLEHTIENNPMWVNMKYYAIEKKSRNFVLNWLKDNVKNKVVLDYCAGNGEDGVYVAKNGAKHVHGIDISDVSIENCKQLAINNNVQDKTTYIIDDAENTKFENNQFDIITEYGCLHHLDQDKAFKELARILKEDGKMICNEALAHNLFIHLYRKMTPKLRTEWEVEHIMKKGDIMKAKKYFGNVEIHLYHLFSLFAVPFRNYFFFNTLLACLEIIDRIVLKIPIVKWQAWQAVFILSDPIKE